MITDLELGGAQLMLTRLLSRADRRRFDPAVVSLTANGPAGAAIEADGVPVRAVGMRHGVPDPRGVVRLATRLRALRPDVVQTWMYHADLVGGLAAALAGRPPVVWGIRQADLGSTRRKRATLLTARACALLSRRLPARILCNSESSRRAHVAFGYSAARMVVIPNGFDLDVFHPSPAAADGVRTELGLAHDARLVGLVGRFDPDKDHRTFVRAMGRVCADHPDVYAVLVGEGLTDANAAVAGWAAEAGVASRTLLLGARADVPRVTAALDVAVSASLSEGFPNVVGEAMAGAIPCVVTDVGDSAAVVGDTGVVVPPRDPEALAAAVTKLLELTADERRALGAAARRRVAERYALDDVVRRYGELYEEVAAGVRHRRAG